MTVTEKVTGRGHPRAQRWATGGVLCLLVITALACVPKIPNIQPFAAGTASLHQASGAETKAIIAQYNATIKLAGEVLEQTENSLETEDRKDVNDLKSRLEANKQSIEDSSKAFDMVLQQAVGYSEQLAALAAAGRSGGQAAESLANSINGFGALAGAGTLITAPVAAILKRVAAFHTAMRAKKSLRKAAKEAEGAVDEIAVALKKIHSDLLQILEIAIVSDHQSLLRRDAGYGIVEYYKEANERRSRFYVGALRILMKNDGGISKFCISETGEIDKDCVNLSELQALGEVEERLATLKPEFEVYQSKLDELSSWREARRANGERIVRAIDIWVNEHQRVVAALEDGSGVSAFSLRLILAEIQSLQ